MDYSELPLPPNWESRFDKTTGRWYFVNHSEKTTTWTDPRPDYYASHPHLSPDSEIMSEKSRITDNGPLRLENSSDKIENMDRREEDEENDRSQVDQQFEFAQYLEALRAAYPTYKNSQLAKLMEQYLGESDALHDFMASRISRRPSSSSKTRKFSDSKNSDKHKLSSLTDVPPQKSEVSSDHTTILMDSGSTDEVLLQEPTHEAIEEHPSEEQSEPKLTDIKSTPVAEDESLELPEYHEESAEPKPLVPEVTVPTTAEPIVQGGDLVTAVFSRSQYVPRGPDASLLVNRVVPRGPDPQLARGPDRSLLSKPFYPWETLCSYS